MVCKLHHYINTEVVIVLYKFFTFASLNSFICVSPLKHISIIKDNYEVINET